MNIKKYNTGVSIVEIMVVMSIVIILALIGIVKYSSLSEKAYRDGALVAIKAVATALKMYYSDKRVYTTTTSHLIPYTTMTPISKKFDLLEITAIGGVFCSAGRVKDITPIYYVNFCIEGGGVIRTNQHNQPSCCWTPAGQPPGYCDSNNNDSRWYACRSKM